MSATTIAIVIQMEVEPYNTLLMQNKDVWTTFDLYVGRRYLHVCEEHGRVRTVRLHVLHGVPLINEVLVRCHMALIVTDPGEEETAWIVVMTSCHFANLMQGLQGRPASTQGKKKYIEFLCWLVAFNRHFFKCWHLPHGLHRDWFEDVNSVNSGHTEAPVVKEL